MTHTPGEWYVERDGTTVAMAGQCVIIQPAPDGAPHSEARANAHLIAAAPELLKAAKEVLAKECLITTSAGYLEFRALAAAVAKAEGRTHEKIEAATMRKAEEE